MAESNTSIMEEYYGILSNKNEPLQFSQQHLNKLTKQYISYGFFAITTNGLDNEQIKLMIKDIKKSNFLYLPIYKYDNENKLNIYFVVFPLNISKKKEYFDSLTDFGYELCIRYGQEYILIKAAEGLPLYYDMDCTLIGEYESREDLNAFINPRPGTFNEKMRRMSWGEILL